MADLIPTADLPARLKDQTYQARLASGLAQIRAWQQADRRTPFGAIRRADPDRITDRLAAGLDPTEWDTVDAWVIPYGPTPGKGEAEDRYGWYLLIETTIDAVEHPDGPFQARYIHVEGDDPNITQHHTGGWVRFDAPVGATG